MKFKLHQQDLINTVTILEKALGQKTVIESLRGIKIECHQDKIVFIASKSEIAITHTLFQEEHELEIERTGSALISGIHFSNIVRKLNSNTIELEQIENTLHIKTPKSHIELLGYDLNSYPYINFELPEAQTITVDKKLFQLAYKKNKYSISKNQMKPILTGINYNFTKNQLKVSSTDSLRMTFFLADIEQESTIEKDITIAKHIISDINKILDLIEDEQIDLVVSNNQILIKTPNLTVKSRLLDGDFPKMEKVIPKTSSFSFELESSVLSNALNRVLLLTDKDESVVTATFHNDLIKLTSSHQFLGGIEETCPIEKIQGSPFSIAFDPQFVIDAIATIDSDILKLEFVDEVSGFCVKGNDSDQILNIISPIRMV